MFQCHKCGKCCTRFHDFPEGNEWRNLLDSGDGICKYFNKVKRLCSIYESRPVICNNVRYYDEFLKDSMTREEFDSWLNKYCSMIRNDEI